MPCNCRKSWMVKSTKSSKKDVTAWRCGHCNSAWNETIDKAGRSTWKKVS